MNILYTAFGDNISYHLQAYLSIRSFQKQLTAGDRIFVLTTRPEYYRHARVECITVSDSQIEEWKGKHHFPLRAKIKAIEHMYQLHPDDHIFYTDTDTFLYGSLEELRRRLDSGFGLMHQIEGHPKDMKGPTLRMWKLAKGHTIGGITLGEKHIMWNSGVLGIPADKARQVLDTALALCDGMLDSGATAFILEQYGFSVSMIEHTDLKATSDHIGHYWGNKPEWEEISRDLLVRACMKESTLDEELAAITDELLRSTPIRVHKSSTAAKLHKKIDRLFPKRDFIYI